MSSFDVADVDRRARAESKPDDSRQVFVQDIFDWTDSYNENLAESDNIEEAKLALDRLTDLWIAYAAFEISLKQWKKAVQIYDDALQDELVLKQSKIYVSYADFCKSRNKQSNAVKVYVKGLKAGLDDEHYDQIWIKFGEFMNSTSPQKLTFEDLYSAISQQVDIPMKKPSAAAIDVIEGRKSEVKAKSEAAAPPLPPAANIAPSLPFPTPVVKVEPGAQPPLPTAPRPPSAPHAPPPSEQTAQVPMEVAEEQSSLPEVDMSLPDLGDMTGFKYPEDCRLYRHRPPSLFSSPDTEPMISGLDALSVDELNTLESYLGVTDIDPFQQKERGSVYERVLDVLEGMWYAQALKERHFDIWFSELIRMHTAEENDLQKNHGRGDRLKVELERMRRKNALQIELINVIINKTLLSILKEQQVILNSISFPFCDRILTVSSLGELEPQKLSTEIEHIMKQKRMVSAALSLRLKPKAAAASASARTPLSDGKKRKKTRRKLSSGDSPGADMITDSTNSSPVADQDTIVLGNPLKRPRLAAGLGVSSVPSGVAAPMNNVDKVSGNGTNAAKLKAAANINPATLPLLQQLAKMLQKNKKPTESAASRTAECEEQSNKTENCIQ